MTNSDQEFMLGSAHGPGLNICGIAPQKRLVTVIPQPCWNCEALSVVRLFSGSGWYEDSLLCAACGEDVGTGYRPFERAWRKKNMARAEEWMKDALPFEEFHQVTFELIRKEMDWTHD